MKKLFSQLVLALMTFSIFAQAPQKMSYQAVIRNSTGQLVSNHAIEMRISILQESATGTAVYVETQTPTTNANGLATIEIGVGTVVSGTFTGINWATGTYFIKTETDPAGGTNYTITGTSQLLSVPYALFAQRAGEHYVGELFGGGVVFYVDPTGSHGLICSMLNFNGIWSQYLVDCGASSTWDGQENTNKILECVQYDPLSAVMICHEYVNEDYGTGIYSNWYLPAIDEVVFISKVVYELNKTLKKYGIDQYHYVGGSYWSSTESPLMGGIAESFNPLEGKILHLPKSTDYPIRPIRAF